MAFIQQQQATQSKGIIILNTCARLLLYTIGLALPLFFLPYTQDTINLPKQIFLAIGTLSVLLLWLFRVVQSKTVIVRRTILDKPILLFLGVVLVSSIFSLIPSISFLGKTSDFVFHTTSLVLFVLWVYLLVQYLLNSQQWRTFADVLLVSSSAASLFFLLRRTELVQSLVQVELFNTVSSSNSTYAVFIALTGALAIGLLLVRGRSLVSQAIALITAVLALLVLTITGFTLGWGMFALALGLVLVIGISFMRGTYLAALSVTFFIFLISVLLVFVGSPVSLKAQLPVEVALGSVPTWDIAQQAFLSDVKSFFIGSGPGTFTQDFSLYRSRSFNDSAVAWAVRFEHPFNVPFGLVAELGVLGILSFVLILLLSLGSMLSAWLRMQPVISMTAEDERPADDPIKLEVFVFVAVFLAATISMGFLFYDITLWWLWWTLLAVSMIGLSSLIPTLIKEKGYAIRTSPQYALVSSFGMILVVTGVIVLGVIGGRFYMADVAYAKSTTMGTSNSARAQLQQAVKLRPGYAPYLSALAQAYFAHAQRISQEENPNPDALISAVAEAINNARRAADIWGNDVETWQTLGLMYRGAEALDPEAIQWAVDSFERAIELEPTNALLHWQLGQALASSGKSEAAIEALKQSIRLKPNYIPSTVDLSQLYESLGDLDRAINVYEPVFQIVGQQPEIMFQLGRLFYNRSAEGDLTRAEESWLQAVRLNPQYVNALYSLGLLYERRGEEEAALQYFEQTQLLVPDNTDVRNKVQRLLAPVAPPPESEEETATQ